MSYVTHEELDAAIAAVTEDIRDTEHRLRNEFTSAFRHEIDRFDTHLTEQDHKLMWINRWTLTALVSILAAIIVYAVR